MRTTEINEAEFHAHDGVRKLFADPHARRFQRVELSPSAGALVIGWQSDLIEPSFLPHPAGCLWIGVDCHVACVTIETGQILVSMILPSPLQRIIPIDKGACVVCDCDILVFDADLALRKETSFGHLISKVSVEHGSLLVVEMIDGPPVMSFL